MDDAFIRGKAAKGWYPDNMSGRIACWVFHACNNRDFAGALEHFSAARTYPHNLGEGKHFLTQELDLDYFSGVALRELGQDEMARHSFRSAAESEPASPWMSYYKTLALRSLGKTAAAVEVLEEMKRAIGQRSAKSSPVSITLPLPCPTSWCSKTISLCRKEIECSFTEALVELGLGNEVAAAAETPTGG